MGRGWRWARVAGGLGGAVRAGYLVPLSCGDISHAACNSTLGAVKRRESEYYHSVLTWFDEERDELESSPNKTQAVGPCPSAKFMPRHRVAPCFNPVSHSRPKPSPAVSPELDSSRSCSEQYYLVRSDC